MVILQNEQALSPEQANSPRSGWAQKDSRKLLRAAFRVKSLDDAISFYNRYFGLMLVTKLDYPNEPVQRALMAADVSGEQEDHFMLELREQEGAPTNGGLGTAAAAEAASAGPAAAPRVGDWLCHFTVVVPSTPEVVESLRRDGRGGLVEQELAAVISIHSQGGSKQDKVSLVQDLDAYPWQLMELHGAKAAERLCTVALRVRDLSVSLRWYQEVLGMWVLQSYESTGTGHLSALLGYTPEYEGPLLELRQSADAPLHDMGDAFGWFVVGTTDLSRSMVHLEVQGEEWEKVEIPSCDNPTEVTDAATVSDPDGWRFCLVQLLVRGMMGS